MSDKPVEAKPGEIPTTTERERPGDSSRQSLESRLKDEYTTNQMERGTALSDRAGVPLGGDTPSGSMASREIDIPKPKGEKVPRQFGDSTPRRPQGN